MIAVDKDGDPLPEEIAERPEITALLETVERLRADNAAKAELIAELQSRDGELKPLKVLCRDLREYECALRGARRSKTIKTAMVGGRVCSKPGWLADWRRATGRSLA
jgi:hypothetical protein